MNEITSMERASLSHLASTNLVLAYMLFVNLLDMVELVAYFHTFTLTSSPPSHVIS